MPASASRLASKYVPQYLEWVPTIQDISHGIRTLQFTHTTALSVGYFLLTLVIAGLVWFIFYADQAHVMPPSPPEEPMTAEQMQALVGEEGLDDAFNYDKLVSQRREMEESLVLKGSTDKYDWQQSKTEVEVWFPVPDNLRAKDIAVDVRGTHLAVTFAGETYMEGTLYDSVIPDECNWQLDFEGKDASGGEISRVWLTLMKKTPSARNQFWQSLVLGDAKVDTSPLGPRMVAVDPNDPSTYKNAIDQIKRSAAASKRAAREADIAAKKDN